MFYNNSMLQDVLFLLYNRSWVVIYLYLLQTNSFFYTFITTMNAVPRQTTQLDLLPRNQKDLCHEDFKEY